MTTRVYLVRHGATTLSAEDRFAGSSDVELSNDGREQAAALSERLADDPIVRVYASPMHRTRETAAIIARPHGLEPELRDGLREISHGRWEGLTRKEVEQRFDGEYVAWDQDPFTFAPEGGESGLSVMARALPVLREIVLILAHPDQAEAYTKLNQARCIAWSMPASNPSSHSRLKSSWEPIVGAMRMGRPRAA